MKKLDVLLLGIILIIALSLRLYKVQTPLSDFHSWRQADTAAVGRNLARTGFNLLKPTYDDFSNIQSGKENPNGYRFVEFPLYNATFGVLYRYLPIVSIEVYGRIVSIAFSLILISIIYYLSLKEHSRVAAVAASGVYAIFPFFVFFSRVVLPESMAISLMFISIWLLYLYLHAKKSPVILIILSIIMFAASILVKPTTVFYALSIAYLFIMTYKFDIFKKWQPYVFVLMGILPFILWSVYILQYPEGIPVSNWLFRSVNTPEGMQDIFFRPAFFRWIFMERIGTLILGIYLTGFLIVGCIGKYKSYFLHSTLFAALVYLFTFQGGNVQHEYYQTLILPALALMVGLGIGHLLQEGKNNINLYIAYPAVIGVISLSWFFSYYKVKGYYDYNGSLPQIAKLINTFTQPDDTVVTDTVGDTTLLYLADRKGAPATYKTIPELKNMGYDYFVTSKREVVDDLKKLGYEVVIENDQFSLIKL
jgi:hypothetical protein